jgi:hypothetical protein
MRGPTWIFSGLWPLRGDPKCRRSKGARTGPHRLAQPGGQARPLPQPGDQLPSVPAGEQQVASELLPLMLCERWLKRLPLRSAGVAKSVASLR